MSARTAHWQHADGEEASVASLVHALSPFARALCDAHEGVYEGTDMKVGIETQKLLEWKPLLTALVRIDRRGGYFSQRTLATTLQTSLDNEHLADRFCANTLASGRSHLEQYQVVTYKLRVMLSHIRLKFDGGVKDDRFKEIYDILANKSFAKRQRRSERVATDNPFVCFRPAVPAATLDDEDEEEDEDDSPVAVVRYFNGSEAVALGDSGKIVPASSYNDGGEWFGHRALG